AASRSSRARQGSWLALGAPLLLAACGFNGTDADEGDAAEATATPTPTDPEFAEWEEASIADTQPRPQMQLQVIPDEQRFGPGGIDGKEGLSTSNALKGFQEANGLTVTGELDEATRRALAPWRDVPATRVVRIPESWGQLEFAAVPEEPADQAKMEKLGYESLDEKL